MSVRLQFGTPDEAGFLAAGGQIDDGTDSWWAGAQLCFARVALATALAATTLTAAIASDLQQDLEEIPAGSLKVFSTPDEDYWQNPVPSSLFPVACSIYQQLPYARLDPEELPAGSLAKFPSPDEDFWDNPLIPIATANYVRLPHLPDPEETPAGKLANFISPDEDLWQNPLSPIATANFLRLPYLPDPEEIPAGKLYGQPDEDYWANGVALPTFCRTEAPPRPYLPDLGDDPAASLRSQLDEDYWQNPVAPVPPSVYQKLPILPDLSDDPAGSLRGQPDEDFWANLVAPAPPSIYQPLPIAASEPGDIVPSVAFQPDEDFWQSAIAPVPPTLYQRLPYLPDPTDDPAGSLHGQPDEDFWVNPVPPVPLALYQPLPITAGEPADIIPPLVVFQPDEDFWQNPVAPVPAAVYQRLPYLPDATDDPAGSLLKFVSPDEDYWQNAASPPPPTLYQGLPYASGETAEIPPQTVLPPDEDFWQNPVAPTPPCGPKPSGLPSGAFAQAGGGPPALYGQLPYLPDVSDDPAGSLAKFSSPDEDYPQFAQIAQTAQNLVPAFADSGEAPGPAFQPDEDYWPPLAAATGGWQNPQIARITQIGWNVWPQPWTFESPEPAGSLYGVPEEFYWQNPVAPVPPCGPKPSGGGPPALYGQLPYLPDPTDDPAGSLRILAEETEWLNSVAPVAARVFQLLPYASGEAAEFLPAVVSDEDCWPPLAIATGGWQNPIIPAQAARTWMQPAAYGFDEFSSYWWTSRWAVRTHSAARKRASRSTARARTSRGISRQSFL
jgi:hypothetical protein